MANKMAKMEEKNSVLRERYEVGERRCEEMRGKIREAERKREGVEGRGRKERGEIGPCLREVKVKENSADKENREEEVILKRMSRGSIEKRLNERDTSTDRRTSGKMETLLQRLQLRIERA